MLTNPAVVDNHLVDFMTSYRVHSADISVLIGPDSLDVLHAVTTQSISNLSDNTCIFASILNSNGRMIDRILIWNLVDQIAIIHLDGCSESTRKLLSKSVSWKQDVKIIPLDSGFSSIWQYDSQVTGEIMSITVSGQVHSCLIDESTLVHLGPNPDINQFSLNLKNDGAISLDIEGLRLYQIMNGIINGEIVRNYQPIPLEVALSNDISFTKGCYTGQEIIARMDARGALSKTLVTFSSTSILDLGNHRIVGGGRVMVLDSINNNGTHYNLGLIHPDIADEGVEFELDEISCSILTKW